MLRFLLVTGLVMGQADPVGLAPFAVVVHRSNPNTDLRFTDVQAFFAGTVKQWPNGSKVVLVERSTGSAADRFLLTRILHMSATEYKRRLASIEFAGETPVTIKILNSEEAACKFVFNVPGAIAVIEMNSLRAPECGGVETARIDGRLPGQEGYRLQ
jgi:ABC-type phosphate transport system substrate-binding protein